MSHATDQLYSFLSAAIRMQIFVFQLPELRFIIHDTSPVERMVYWKFSRGTEY
jgi:hypothetical protein